MEDNRKYLFEVCIYRIKFNPHIDKLPDKKKMDVFVSFKDLLNLHINGQSELIAIPTDDISLKKYVMNLNYWKSQEFDSKPTVLTKLLNQSPLELWFSTDRDPMSLGKVRVPWPMKFYEFVTSTKENHSYPAPYSFKGAYELLAKNDGKVIGEVDLSVTMSCPFTGQII